MSYRLFLISIEIINIKFDIKLFLDFRCWQIGISYFWKQYLDIGIGPLELSIQFPIVEDVLPPAVLDEFNHFHDSMQYSIGGINEQRRSLKQD
jgi:hypothetical protein